MKLEVLIFILKIIYILSFESTAEGKETESIFIAEGILKHHKYRKQVVDKNGASHINDELNKLQTNDAFSLAHTKIVEMKNGPVYFSSWVKYFKYMENDINISNTPKTFVINNAFDGQGKLYPGANLNEKDTDGKNRYIKDKSSFWLNVFADTIDLISSKQQNIQNTFDSFTIDNIQKVYEDEGYDKGGVLNFGNFNEGFCSKIMTEYPNYSWIFCLESDSQRNSFMETVKNLKIARQMKIGEINIASSSNVNKSTITQILNPGNNSSKIF
jgi:hypothetical protein